MPVRPTPFIAMFLWTALALTIVAQSQDFYNNYTDPLRDELCQTCNQKFPRLNLAGFNGQPWRESELGGCQCGNKSALTNYNFSSSWQSPFSVLMDHGRCGDQRRCTADTRNSRLRDKLDLLAGLRLVGPIRTDNGYCGKDCDPFGYLGNSQRGASATVNQQPVERVPEIAPLESLTLIPRSPTRQSNSPSLGKVFDFKRPASQAPMTHLYQRTIQPSLNESGPTVLTGNSASTSVKRESTGVVRESVAEDASSRGTVLR